jgi:hypothetical protein
MNEPEPAAGWPEDPLSEADATDLLEGDVVAVWVMDHDDGVRSVVAGANAPEDAVVDVVLETDTTFEMYSYSKGQWMDYGTQQKDDEKAPSMAGTLESYRVVAGESKTF